MTTRIKLRRDTAANWAANNPILALGEPGLDTDNNQVKYGDGVTEWSGLSYSGSGVSVANRVVATYWSDSLGLYSTTTDDGQNWTSPVTMDFEYGMYGVNEMAVGPNGTVYTYGSIDGNYLGFQASPFEMPMKCQPLAVVNQGPNGEAVNWVSIRYVGGYYIACGSIQVGDGATRPTWAYSADGVNWTRGSISTADMDTIVSTAAGIEDQIYGLYIEDVSYNGTGWLFNCGWDWSITEPTANPGGFYITNVGAELSSANYSDNVPHMHVVKWAGSGWVGVRYDGGTTLRALSGANPLATTWASRDFDTALTTQLGPWPSDPYYAGIYGLEVGTINSTTYTILTTDYGRAVVTTDLGVTWHAVVPNPEMTYMTGVDAGTDGNSVANVPVFQLGGNYSLTQGEKITVTGATTASMNGTWYIGAQADPGWYFVYRTAAMDTGVSDFTDWGIDTTNITVSATYGSNLVSVSDTTNLVAGMFLNVEGPIWGKISSVDTVSKTITMEMVAWDDMFSYSGISAYPAVTFSNGSNDISNVIFSEDGYFLIEEYNNYQNSGWNKSTDPINSWNGGESYDPAASAGFDGLIAVSSNRVTLPATSWSYVDPMFKNSASVVSLTDKFQVSLGGGNRYSPPATMNLIMDPSIVGWSLGATTSSGWGGDLGTVSSYENNDVTMSISGYRFGVDNNGKFVAPVDNWGNARTQSGNSEGLIFRQSNTSGYQNQKVIGTENGTYSYQTVERLVLSGGDSYNSGGTYAGEGGDIYLWAGKGANGGDIKVDAGNSLGENQEGGTIKIRGGASQNTGGYGGFIEIYAGDGVTVGGMLDMKAGAGAIGANVHLYAGQGTSGDGGTVTIAAGQGTANSGDIILSILGTSNSWTFDHAGKLTLPASGTVSYTPAEANNWTGTAPTTIQEAIDRLAAVVKTLNSGTGA